MSTQAEQNRLIIEHAHLVEPIAATFRGKKNIPFEDLVQQGMKALCLAARDWRQLAPFQRYAFKYIEQEIKQFVAHWQVFERLNENSIDTLERIHEWQIWGHLPSEGWTKLFSTPERLREVYEEIRDRQEAVAAAMLSLTPLERKLVEKHYLRSPPLKVTQIARDERMSYRAAMVRIHRALRKMRWEVRRFIENRALAVGA